MSLTIYLKRLKMFTKYTVHNLSVKQMQSVIYIYGKQMYSNSTTNNELRYPSDYDNYILKILNNKKVDYFKRYEIPQFYANELHKYRDENGVYKSLKDVLKIEGMTQEILDKFILSIINGKKLKKDKLQKFIVSSSLHDISQEQISTVLGINIETNTISWTLLETKENILEWNYENCVQNSRNESTSHLLKLACTINNKIPKADIYVVNDTSFNFHMVKSVAQIQTFLRKEQLKAMILAFLTQKNLSLQKNNEDLSNTDNIYLLKCENIAKLFDIYIGQEIMSTSTVIKKLLCKTDGRNIETKNPIGVITIFWR
ncbi:PREDICTED: uncharacterized protein LOC107074277 isoform X2 [Polistes dominula]|uniref:Uncharacterized protein LOC107074277 isoform X2 n=1 Tax=Polistes dominula TaxID=743375 RepID=A0ABM1JEY2_POLDO|nr:PREDICTED: uncharacterized protein LOC107074277 isoform X2 [Polistes dominula]